MRRSRTSALPNNNRRLSVADLPRNGRTPVEDRPSEPAPEPKATKKARKNKLTWRQRRAAKKAQKAADKKHKQPSALAKRWLGRLSLLTGLIVVVSASVAVAWGLRRYLRTSPRFSLREIRVEGNQRRTPTQVAKQANLQTGLNIFTVEEDITKEAVEADPWIDTAEVKVSLPGSVTIQVTEREARALAIVEGQLFLVDTKGNIFKELGPQDPRDLPVVSGIDPARIAKDRDHVTAQIRRAMDLVSDLEQAKIAKRYPVQELHLEENGAVRVTVGTDGIVLVFGTPPFRAKVDKAERILEELRYRKVQRAVLFLDNRAHPERVVVRLQTTAPKEAKKK